MPSRHSNYLRGHVTSGRWTRGLESLVAAVMAALRLITRVVELCDRTGHQNNVEGPTEQGLRGLLDIELH